MRADKLNGKVALITGAANGIGSALARRLRSLGASIVAADIDDAAGKPLAKELDGRYVHCDVRDPAANVAMVDAAVDEFGGVDLVFLNAGVTTATGFGGDFSLEDYRRAMAVNFDGVAFGMQAALPTLRDRGGGSIIATASMAALTPAGFDPIYGANKAAVVHLVRSVAEAVRNDNISVNAVCPSFAETAIIADIKPSLVESGFPILEVEDVVDTFMEVLAHHDSGQAWYVVPGRRGEPFVFRNVPGPRSSEP